MPVTAACLPGDINTKISWYRERVRLEVEYETSPGHGADWGEAAIEVYTLGLTRVRKLADRWGHDRWGTVPYPSHQRWWAELNRRS
jgi:hypothetical protein